MVLHGQHARRVVQLLAHVLAHPVQGAATRARRGLGLVADLDVWQVLGELRPPGLGFLLVVLQWRCLQVLKLGLQRSDVGVHRFLEQRPLLGIELFAARAELDAPQVGDLVGQLLQLGIAPLDLMGVLIDAREQVRSQLAQLALAQRGELFRSDPRGIEHGRQSRKMRPPPPSAHSRIAAPLCRSAKLTRRG